MSIGLILMGLGLVTVVLIIEDGFDAIWNAVVAKRRKAEEDARLQRIERIVADASRTRTPVVVEERGGRIELVQFEETISHDAGDDRYLPALPARIEP